MIRVLIVDDEPDVISTLRRALPLIAKNPYEISSASSYDEAIQKLVNQKFDYAILDMRLNDGGETDESGLHLAMALPGMGIKTRVIMLSKFTRTKQIVRAMRYQNVIDFVSKSSETMLEDIDNAIARSESGLLPQYGQDTEQTLSLSLVLNQPIVARARGLLTCAVRSTSNLHLRTEQYVGWAEIARQDRHHQRTQANLLGQGLWKSLFEEMSEVQGIYQDAKSKSKGVTLSFESPRDMLQLPLEFLHPPDKEYLVLQHPFFRFIYPHIAPREPLSPLFLRRMLVSGKTSLRALLIAANTSGEYRLPSIPGVDAEVKALANFFEKDRRLPESQTINVQYDMIPSEQATYTRVMDALSNPAYDIIHYAGHSSFNLISPEESCLYLWEKENCQGRVLKVKASDLKLRLEESNARLMYLSSCFGTSSGSASDLVYDDFMGLADAILMGGIPTILGYRWAVTDDKAPLLAHHFYASLLNQGSPPIALWQARRQLAQIDRDDPAWLSPILIHQE